jgi:hypothetical protein
MEDTFQFEGPLVESGNKLWGFHVLVPEVVANTLLAHDAKRVVCTLQGGRAEFQAGLIPKGDGRHCIMINKKLRDQLGLRPGSLVQLALQKDDSEYGLPMPEELAEVLAQDEEGHRLFHALPAGKIRTLLYIVSQVKNSDARIGRAMTIVAHLHAQGGKLNYKILHEDLKLAQKI